MTKTPSNGTEGEWSFIHAQSKDIKCDHKKHWKVDDIKELITNVVDDLFKKHQDKNRKEVNDKIELLKQENREFKNRISQLESDKRALQRDLH